MNTHLLTLYAKSPLHAGTGQAVGAVDLPIARERATGIPFLPGSSIKGVLRDHYGAKLNDESQRQRAFYLFGPDTDHAEAHAGSLHFGDGRLLLLPVRSLCGTFAYVTSPYLLERFEHDVKEAGLNLPFIQDTNALPKKPSHVLVTEKSVLIHQDHVVFEEFKIKIGPRKEVSALAKALCDLLDIPSLEKRLAIVDDDTMSFFMEYAMDLSARTRLEDDTKVVAKGALWYEESLPAESVLVSLAISAPPKKTNLKPAEAISDLKASLTHMLQFGGNATTGKGFCQVKLHGAQS